MNIAMLLSSIALAGSIVVSGMKLLQWFINTEPRALTRMIRRALPFLALASIPCLVLLLIHEKWELAMLLGAGMLVIPTILSWRSLFSRLQLRDMRTDDNDDNTVDAMRGDFGQPPPDPELARRAAIILEDYVNHVRKADLHGRERPITETRAAPAAPMTVAEALDVLGMEAGATADAIHAAHRRLVQLLHPDRGGSHYLTTKINEAKAILLNEAGRKPAGTSRPRTRVRSRQAAGGAEYSTKH